MELLGGRAIHPVNVRIGGFHRTPTRDELRLPYERLKRAMDDAWATVRWVSRFDFPDAVCDEDFFALSEPGRYAIAAGTPTVPPTAQNQGRSRRTCAASYRSRWTTATPETPN
jgi:hypothetical protein